MVVSLSWFITDKLDPVLRSIAGTEPCNLMVDFVTDTIHLHGNGVGRRVLGRAEMRDDNWQYPFHARVADFLSKMPAEAPGFDWPIKDNASRVPDGMEARLSASMEKIFKVGGRIGRRIADSSVGWNSERLIAVPCRNNTADVDAAWRFLEQAFSRDLSSLPVSKLDTVYVRTDPEVGTSISPFGITDYAMDDIYETTWGFVKSYVRIFVPKDAGLFEQAFADVINRVPEKVN